VVLCQITLTTCFSFNAHSYCTESYLLWRPTTEILFLSVVYIVCCKYFVICNSLYCIRLLSVAWNSRQGIGFSEWISLQEKSLHPVPSLVDYVSEDVST